MRIPFLPATDRRDCILARLPGHSVGAEIGVYQGEFSELTLRRLRPAKLHLIDPWRYEENQTYSQSWYGGSVGDSQAKMDAIYESVRCKLGSRANVVIHRTTSAACASLFPDGYFDWVYVDGNHLYEFVRKDLELYLPKLKPCGFLCGDDYGIPGWWEDGVTRAVNELIAANTPSMAVIENHQFLLRFALTGTRKSTAVAA